MILLVGVSGEAPLERIHKELTERRQEVALLDQRHVLDYEIDVTFAREVTGEIRLGERVIDLADITAVYWRPYSLEQIPALSRQERNSRDWRHASGMTDILCSWAELTRALVINRLSSMASNGSKPYQSLVIHACGFETPETLITNDTDALREFWLRHGTVIYKSISGVRSIVTRLGQQHVERFPLLHWCPTQFQQYVPGADYRVHVVDNETFGTKIICDADDYRYAARSGHEVRLEAWQVPEDVAQRCLSLTHTLGLHFAGIDLRFHPAGKWFCFEVNPSPAFTFYQDQTGQEISRAVARLLIEGGAELACLPARIDSPLVQ